MLCSLRADSRFAPSQWETALFCNDVSHWLGTNLESALRLCMYYSIIGLYALMCRILMIHVYGLLEERFIRRVLSWKGSISFLPWKWDIFLEECLKHGSYIYIYIYIYSLENTTWLTKLIRKPILTNISLLWFGFCYINFFNGSRKIICGFYVDMTFSFQFIISPAQCIGVMSSPIHLTIEIYICIYVEIVLEKYNCSLKTTEESSKYISEKEYK